MPFLFSHVCDLLDDLEQLHIRPYPLLTKELHHRTTQRANQWLKAHKFNLNAFSTHENAVLWVLRPDKLEDRVYGIDGKRLEHIIARAYELGNEDFVNLQQWQILTHKGDLGTFVELVRSGMKPPSVLEKDMVSVEEIQNLMVHVASWNLKSSPAIRSLRSKLGQVDVVQSLGDLLKRMHGREAKWFVRYILKDYRAILLPDSWEVESGYLGMPNVASITLNMFSRPPPIPVLLDETRLIKGVKNSIEKKRAGCPRSGLRKSQHGWPKRTMVRSKEASPLSPPLSFARGLLTPRVPAFRTSMAPLSSTGTSSSSRGLELDAIPLSTSLACSSENEPATNDAQDHRPITSRESPPSASARENSSFLENTPEPESFKSNNTKGAKSKVYIDLTQSSPTPSQKSCPTLPNVKQTSSVATTIPRSALSNLPTNSLLSQTLSRKNKGPMPRPLLESGNGICNTTSSCLFTRCIFLLSPSLSINSRLTTTLLPQHHSQHFSNPSHLKHPAFPVCCPRTRRRYRKIILVNTYQRAETVAFLKKVQDLQLQRTVRTKTRRRGNNREWVKEWIEVYDWRVVEMVGKMEAGKVYDYDVWQRCFVCTI